MRAHLRGDKNGVFLVTESGKWDFCPLAATTRRGAFCYHQKPGTTVWSFGERFSAKRRVNEFQTLGLRLPGYPIEVCPHHRPHARPPAPPEPM